jgi:polyferredoxin
MGSPIGQAQGSGARRDGGRKRRRRLAIVVLVVVNCIVAVGAPIIDIWYIHNIDPAQVPFEAGAGLIAVTTFFGIWIIQRELDVGDHLTAMRDAISGAAIVVYLVVFSWVAFFPPGYNTGPLNTLTLTLITNFTVIIGIVVTFYLGTIAYVQVSERRQRQSDAARRED